MKQIYLSNICILYCPVSLNSVHFNLFCFDLVTNKNSIAISSKSNGSNSSYNGNSSGSSSDSSSSSMTSGSAK